MIEKEYLKYDNETNNVVIDKEVEEVIKNLIIENDRISTELKKYKDEIKSFIEDNSIGSFKTDLLDVKYTSATTTTTIDTAKLKSKYADIAAECSKVGAKASSISLKALEVVPQIDLNIEKEDK